MATRTTSAGKARKSPEFATNDTGVTHPYIDATPPYMLWFHPSRWMVMEGKLVPQLGKLPLVAGINHVEYDGEGRVKFARTRALLEEQGRTLIPYEWAPDGESYIKAVDTKPQGRRDVREAWISVFETAHVGDAETSTDTKAYAGWMRKLIDDGKLPDCPPHHARRMLETSNGRLRQAEQEAAKAGNVGPTLVRLESLRAEVAVLEAAVKGYKPAKAPTKAATGPAFAE
jgi:hypothetical protein